MPPPGIHLLFQQFTLFQSHLTALPQRHTCLYALDPRF